MNTKTFTIPHEILPYLMTEKLWAKPVETSKSGDSHLASVILWSCKAESEGGALLKMFGGRLPLMFVATCAAKTNEDDEPEFQAIGSADLMAATSAALAWHSQLERRYGNKV